MVHFKKFIWFCFKLDYELCGKAKAIRNNGISTIIKRRHLMFLYVQFKDKNILAEFGFIAKILVLPNL